ncbi:MAG TPA: bifunctional hydroxymethylpyrimidine kinase/phosphomethylpyrimidine kinase [Candidatus Tumulicola sp.]|nr:bifunctional hydroxymethylpyrimidine kinase/phosphomethylpyrimidine kinase [Candidatus Tumulicola sp.]
MIVLSIGTTHPWNVAGTGRDLVLGTELGARVFTAIAAVSAQDAGGVRALHPIPPAALRAQLAALPWSAAGAVRVGALASAENVRCVAAALRAHGTLPAVVDPVFFASRGGALADDATRHAIGEELSVLPNAVLTPNLDEAAALLGSPPIGLATMGEAAAALRLRGPEAVLLKGGHLEGDPVDALATVAGVQILREPRIAGTMHGTGCTLAMALACALAGGAAVDDAVRRARAFVRAQLARH